jgi:hypothetical protein
MNAEKATCSASHRMGHPTGRITGLMAGSLAAVLALTACAGLGGPSLNRPDPAAVAALNRMQAHPCNGTVAAALASYNIPIGDIRSLFHTEIIGGVDDDTIIKYQSWMESANQPGRLVVETDPFGCRLIQTYTRYGASFPGVSSF